MLEQLRFHIQTQINYIYFLLILIYLSFCML